MEASTGSFGLPIHQLVLYVCVYNISLCHICVGKIAYPVICPSII